MRSFLRANWRGVTIGVTALAIFCAAILVLSTMPPRAIVMATGPEGGGFEEVGRQYHTSPSTPQRYAGAARSTLRVNFKRFYFRPLHFFSDLRDDVDARSF